MKLIFMPGAWEDLMYWYEHDKAQVKRIHKLIADMQRSPYSGIGKPEPLRYTLAGYWSRRIDDTHRIVYTATEEELIILQCRGHYES